MNAYEINNILKQDRVVSPYLLGVFPCDKLPKNPTIPCALIANTDSSEGEGKHWIGIYVNHDGVVMYFDSYGFPPGQQEFLDFIASIANHYVSNNIQLQSQLSSACGQFSIFFLAMACRGCTIPEIQRYFQRNDLTINDQRVTNFVNENYDAATKAYDFDYIMMQICRSMQDVLGKHCPIHQ